jgi:hypothetical protein
VLAAGSERIAKGELLAVEAAARGKFPFGFGRQFLAGPFGVPVGRDTYSPSGRVQPINWRSLSA